MRNKLLGLSMVLGSIATILGIISTNVITNDTTALTAFRYGSTASFLGIMAVFSIIVSRLWGK